EGIPRPPEQRLQDRQAGGHEGRPVSISRSPAEEARISRALDRADQRRRARARALVQRFHQWTEQGSDRHRPQGSCGSGGPRQACVYEDRGTGEGLLDLIRAAGPPRGANCSPSGGSEAAQAASVGFKNPAIEPKKEARNRLLFFG